MFLAIFDCFYGVFGAFLTIFGVFYGIFGAFLTISYQKILISYVKTPQKPHFICKNTFPLSKNTVFLCKIASKHLFPIKKHCFPM
jgi:hypothetical protein